jgi:cell division protein FtsQ
VNADSWLERLGRRGPRRSSPPVSSNPARRDARPTRRQAVRRRRIRRPGPRRLIGIVLGLAVLAGAWLWLRDSSLVAVRRVTVTGERGPDARRIRSALMLAARNMTTLDVKLGALHTAVAPYPVVKSLRVSTQFPHGMRIKVIEEIPVGEIVMGAHAIAVASDGTLLHDAGSVPHLPTIELRSLPGADRITDRDGLEIVALLAAAPYQLLSHLSQAASTAGHGLVAQLRNGPSIYFGDANRLAAKWIAASAVLADGGSDGAQYIDVTDPERPVAGASGSPASAAGTTTGQLAGVTGSGAGGTTSVAGDTSSGAGGTTTAAAGTGSAAAGSASSSPASPPATPSP